MKLSIFPHSTGEEKQRLSHQGKMILFDSVSFPICPTQDASPCNRYWSCLSKSFETTCYFQNPGRKQIRPKVLLWILFLVWGRGNSHSKLISLELDKLCRRLIPQRGTSSHAVAWIHTVPMFITEHTTLSGLWAGQLELNEGELTWILFCLCSFKIHTPVSSKHKELSPRLNHPKCASYTKAKLLLWERHEFKLLYLYYKRHCISIYLYICISIYIYMSICLISICLYFIYNLISEEETNGEL